MGLVVWLNVPVTPGARVSVAETEATVAPVGSTIWVRRVNGVVVALLLATSVWMATVADVLETTGVVTKVPYHVT